MVGDAIAIQLRDALKRIPKVRITDGMGSTESGITGIAEPSADGLMRLPANELHQVIVEDRIGRPHEMGVIGRAGNIPLGYYKDPKKPPKLSAY